MLDMTQHLNFDEPDKRIGRFRVANFTLRSNPVAIAAVMTNVMVLKFQELRNIDCVEYTAISPLFEKFSGTGEVPEYMMICETDDGVCSIRSRKII